MNWCTMPLIHAERERRPSKRLTWAVVAVATVLFCWPHFESEAAAQNEAATQNQPPSGNPENLSYIYSGGWRVSAETIFVLKRWLKPADRYVMELLLLEIPFIGPVTTLGYQMEAVSSGVLIRSVDQREVIIQVPWATRALQSGSTVAACVQVFVVDRNGNLGQVTDSSCRTFQPPG